MGLVIGMDEAGYGPNLGPLVVTVTVWETRDDPRRTDFWTEMSDVVTQSRTSDRSLLHIADSKQVYSPSRGIAGLERGVLCALRLCEQSPAGFGELWKYLDPQGIAKASEEPWFDGSDLPLPRVEHAEPIDDVASRWQESCQRAGIRLKAICSDVVLTSRFNRLTREYNSKGVALSRISLRLLRRVWDPFDSEPTFIVADKHGGRNRYDALLSEILDGQLIFGREEGNARSSYRVGVSEVRFQTRAESHFPVAVASMVSKYVREGAMELFNRFWSARIPDLKPTKGYPVDARRFRADIADAVAESGITNDILWRER